MLSYISSDISVVLYVGNWVGNLSYKKSWFLPMVGFDPTSSPL